MPTPEELIQEANDLGEQIDENAAAAEEQRQADIERERQLREAAKQQEEADAANAEAHPPTEG